MIDVDDLPPLLEEVANFARGRVAVQAARPEHPMDAAMLAALTGEATTLGILPAQDAGADAGVGLWEHVDTGHALAFNTGLLRQVAQANPALAFSWHRQALAHRLARELNLALPPHTHLHPVGHLGLGRTSLARWLGDQTLTADDNALLADWADRHAHETPVLLPDNWQAVVWPIWLAEGLQWQVLARGMSRARTCAPQHGLDELRLHLLSDTRSAGPHRAMSPESLARMLKLDMIGLLAIGAGSLDRAEAQAVAHASVRRQGGKLIARHPAVHQMLSEIAATRQGVEVALGACAHPADELDLGLVAGLRASQHRAMCEAANQAMQVHGGVGYMRDLGVEKIVRDLNMLRMQTGGLREIPAFITGWNGGQE